MQGAEFSLARGLAIEQDQLGDRSLGFLVIAQQWLFGQRAQQGAADETIAAGDENFHARVAMCVGEDEGEDEDEDW